MFVKKLVEKASLKKPGGISDGLKPEEVNPRVVFHYGIPSGSVLLAYDPIQKILAVSTNDGRIKLFGRDNTQSLLESSETVPSKFLKFIQSQGVLININVKNHIEVWDIERNSLSHVHVFEEEITSFTVMQSTSYMFIGDSVGNVSVLKLDEEAEKIVQMKYTIPFSASHETSTEVAGGHTAVLYILPQPTAESKRVLIIYRDGFITLWSIPESKPIFTTGGTMLHSISHEPKKVTAACWACPFGSKLVVGYSNGEIFIWGIPTRSNSKTESETDKEFSSNHGTPTCKLNLGYKLDKIPIVTLKWVYALGKASRLYALGTSDIASANLLQVILINEHTESRTIKLGLHPPEPCLDMEIISSFNEQSKRKQDYFLVLGKSGQIYAYDDMAIEKYLLQSQSRSPPSIPKEVMVKLPLADSTITVSKFVTDNQCYPLLPDEEYAVRAKHISPLFMFEAREGDGIHSNSVNVSGFTKIKNLWITGHSNGAINFWDVSCPLFLPLWSLVQQSENDFSLSGIPVTALYFNSNSRLLVFGDQSGTVRIFQFKPEPFPTGNSFMSFQGNTKKGSSHIVHSVKAVKINGVVLSINTSHNSKHFAVGSDKGNVSLYDMDGPTLLYQKNIASELCTAVISLQFASCSFHGFEKNTLVVATKDSSVMAIESDTGNTLSSGMVHPKKHPRALLMQILEGQEMSEGLDMGRGSSVDDGIPKKLLLCTEKAAYVYSLAHVLQGVKKVYYKKKFHSSCCWASTFSSPPDAGLVLLLSSGKIEIRSLPDLSLLKETSIRGLTLSTSKLNYPGSSICCSRDGEIVMVNGDQEVFLVSVLLHKEVYRHLDSVCQVYKKDLVDSQGTISEPVIHKEKKKGIFSSIMKGSKAKPDPEPEPENVKDTAEELAATFSVTNFPLETQDRDNMTAEEDEIELNIDDIDLDDLEKPKRNPMMAALNKQKLTSTFQAFKGKLKHSKIKNEKSPVKEETQDEKAGAVNQIKKKYGYSLAGETSVAKMTASKLTENLKKLQGINLKTSEMQDSAQSFSSMAKEVLRYAEHDKKAS